MQLFFWYFGVLKAMPAVAVPYFGGGIVVNQRGISFLAAAQRAVHLGVGRPGCRHHRRIHLSRVARRLLEESGRRLPVFWPVLAGIILVPALVWLLTGSHLDFEQPVLQGFNYKGGLNLPPRACRGCVRAHLVHGDVHCGDCPRRASLSVTQRADRSCAGSGAAAARTASPRSFCPRLCASIVPPLMSQHLNLTKNSSLGGSVYQYPDLVNVFMGSALN